MNREILEDRYDNTAKNIPRAIFSSARRCVILSTSFCRAAYNRAVFFPVAPSFDFFFLFSVKHPLPPRKPRGYSEIFYFLSSEPLTTNDRWYPVGTPWARQTHPLLFSTQAKSARRLGGVGGRRRTISHLLYLVGPHVDTTTTAKRTIRIQQNNNNFPSPPRACHRPSPPPTKRLSWASPCPCPS